MAWRCRHAERWPRRAAADLRCDYVQINAAHSVALLQTLPGDVFVAFFTAVSSWSGHGGGTGSAGCESSNHTLDSL
jgi:hypothetical protein